MLIYKLENQTLFNTDEAMYFKELDLAIEQMNKSLRQAAMNKNYNIASESDFNNYVRQIKKHNEVLFNKYPILVYEDKNEVIHGTLSFVVINSFNNIEYQITQHNLIERG